MSRMAKGLFRYSCTKRRYLSNTIHSKRQHMYKTDSEDTLVPTETAPNPRRSCPQSKFPVVEQA